MPAVKCSLAAALTAVPGTAAAAAAAVDIAAAVAAAAAAEGGGWSCPAVAACPAEEAMHAENAESAYPVTRTHTHRLTLVCTHAYRVILTCLPCNMHVLNSTLQKCNMRLHHKMHHMQDSIQPC